jgi:hypothetical protein
MSLRHGRQLTDRVDQCLQHNGQIALRQLHSHIPFRRLKVDEEMTGVRMDRDVGEGLRHLNEPRTGKCIRIEHLSGNRIRAVGEIVHCNDGWKAGRIGALAGNGIADSDATIAARARRIGDVGPLGKWAHVLLEKAGFVDVGDAVHAGRGEMPSVTAAIGTRSTTATRRRAIVSQALTASRSLAALISD